MTITTAQQQCPLNAGIYLLTSFASAAAASKSEKHNQQQHQ